MVTKFSIGDKVWVYLRSDNFNGTSFTVGQVIKIEAIPDRINYTIEEIDKNGNLNQFLALEKDVHSNALELRRHMRKVLSNTIKQVVGNMDKKIATFEPQKVAL